MAENFKRLEDLGRGSYRVQDEKGDVFTYNENSGNRGPVEYNEFAQGESLETSPRDFQPEGPTTPDEIVNKMAELYANFSGIVEGQSEIAQNFNRFRDETPSLPTKEEAFPSVDSARTGALVGGVKGTIDDIMTMGKTFKGMVTEGINKAIEIYKYPSTEEEIEEWNSMNKMLEDDARNKRIEKYRRYGKGLGFSDEPFNQ